eukprot:NODE_31_length_37178_cov_0.413576.p18 type:complete len:223 gc:universal NODE_31_length_37178_cov_0.413576:35198-34530(-)
MFFVATATAQCLTGTGQGTFYDVHNPSENDGYTGQVRCPVSIPGDGIYAAVPSTCFSSGNGVCGQTVNVNYKGKSIAVPIIDECASCEGSHIDLSVGAFKSLESDLNVGVLQGLSWGPGGQSKNVAPPIGIKSSQNPPAKPSNKASNSDEAEDKPILKQVKTKVATKMLKNSSTDNDNESVTKPLSATVLTTKPATPKVVKERVYSQKAAKVPVDFGKCSRE